jgi:hypothetical protein
MKLKIAPHVAIKGVSCGAVNEAASSERRLKLTSEDERQKVGATGCGTLRDSCEAVSEANIRMSARSASAGGAL